MKMKHYFFVTGFLILSLLHPKVNAQTGTDLLPLMDVYSIAVTKDSTEEKNPTDSTVFSVFIHISLSDTINIDQIIVKLGDKGLTDNRMKHVFKWDVFGDTRDGTNYSRNGFNVILSLGNFKGFLQYEAHVEIKLMDGTKTEIVRCSRL